MVIHISPVEAQGYASYFCAQNVKALKARENLGGGKNNVKK